MPLPRKMRKREAFPVIARSSARCARGAVAAPAELRACGCGPACAPGLRLRTVRSLHNVFWP
eukprot:3879356-Prymnesium_polylepis.2